MSLTLQWIIVALIIAIAVGLPILGLLRKRDSGKCNGCALSDTCIKKKEKEHRS